MAVFKVFVLVDDERYKALFVLPITNAWTEMELKGMKCERKTVDSARKLGVSLFRFGERICDMNNKKATFSFHAFKLHEI